MAHTASVHSSRLNDNETDGRIEGRRLRGLSWNKTHQLWRVRIYYNGKLRFVGRFEEAISAAKAYDKAAVYLYGASAITNFGLEACLEDPTEVGACIIRAKEEAEQQDAARQATGAYTPQRAQQRLQQAHSPQQQGTPSSAKSAAASAASHATGVPSPSSSSSRQSHMETLAMLTAAGDPLHEAATAALLSHRQQQLHCAGEASSLLHQVSGISTESLAAVTGNSVAAAAAAAAAIPVASSCMLGALGLHHLQPLQQQQLCSTIGRSSSLPGLGIGASTGLAGAADAACLAEQLLLATSQQQQGLSQHQQQWPLQNLGFLRQAPVQYIGSTPAPLQYPSFKSPCTDLQQNLAMTAACNSQLFGVQHRVALTADCRPPMPAASPPAAAAGMAAGLYNQHLLLQQQQQQAMLRQQLVQQELQELALQEAMLSSAAAAAAAAAFSSGSSGGTLPLGSSCRLLFGAPGGPPACFAPDTASGSPAHLYTSIGSSSGSMGSRWSMPMQHGSSG